ncbi:MAG TPA: hypothetical protein VN673_00505 [Clostridia bacterium]|nr:hypothetical protein [Clostridia bacterium]
MRTQTFGHLLGPALLCAAVMAAPADQVTFNVDMSHMTNSAGSPAYSEVRASGAFNGWSQDSILVNNGANIFTNTFEVPADGNYKYTCLINGAVEWEAGNDHSMTLTGSPQTLPLLVFNYGGIVPIDFTTNNITFQVDMTAQGDAFLNAGGQVRVSGGFNGWGDGGLLTNNPSAEYPTNWWYSETFTVITQLVPPSAPADRKINRYKFRANGGWEEPLTLNVTGSNDRWWDATTTGDRVLPLVFYSDASPCELLSQETTVTFQLHLTNGTVAVDGHVFDNSVDTVHVNGESLLGAWQSWNVFLPQLIREAETDMYTNTFIIPPGRPRNQKVKYGINGLDNEAPTYQDHIQWIRTTNTTYVMAPVEFGTNYASARVQEQFGGLTISKPAAGSVPVTWLGGPCVTLQSRGSLGAGAPWVDLPATDSTSSTNVPQTGTEQYFRLNKRWSP